ncbi:outer membrane siderophore receptor [Gluconacetobacter johannae DSM 13595]|uniref:TonB-dependent receptor n=1 Tax=Gluconacetobacter johannae TaxID=112140 RepID=A0A7W4J8U9_9PROT|nr:TonB-dependent receptor [Gluconacetobacter johannae]MBB2176721.1 TonB-dependent receptor [Gluconacetobacter johannae]GBQ79620.1 outer membrane siderophore receptor [Gluconacetobacter johannae DSM 13595]
MAAGTAHAQLISQPATSSGSLISSLHRQGTTTSRTSNGTEEIQVTGSHLANRATAEIAPITTITAQQLQNSSATNLEMALHNIPSMGFGGTYRTNVNAGGGSTCTDFRSMGVDRLLVLVDGRRVVSGPNGCANINAIPMEMVDRVVFLKDGASSLYGADAVSGVLNIILKKNYSGTTVNFNGGISGYDGDSPQATASITHGFNFDHDRGNITLNGTYNYQAPTLATNRPWALHSGIVMPGPGQPIPQSGSILTPGGAFYSMSGDPLFPGADGGGIYTNGGAGGPANSYRPFTPQDRYDYAKDTWMADQNQFESITANGRYDLTDHVQLYLLGTWTHTDTLAQLSGDPIANPSSEAANLPDAVIIPAGLPGNPFGQDVGWYSRPAGLGNRNQQYADDQYQITVGARGDIPHSNGWTWDLYYSFGKDVQTSSMPGSVNGVALEQALGFRQTGLPDSLDQGVYDPSVCSAAAGCALINPFSPATGISDQARKFITYNNGVSFSNEMRDVQLLLRNNHLFRMPYGPAGLAFGVEHRSLDAGSTTDLLNMNGYALNTVTNPTSGAYNATEVYGELSVPLLRDLPGAQNLAANVAGRFSHYNTFGETYNWSGGLIWSPVNDISFRVNYGTGFRQPTISDLYSGQQVSFQSAYDPCATDLIGTSANRMANCMSQGVPAGGINQTSADQVRALIGGNPKVQPEISRTYTIGTVIHPHFIPNLSFTVDYYHTSITHQIGTFPAQDLLDSCYDSAGLKGPTCSNLGSPARDASHQLLAFNDTTMNMGGLRTSGLDINGSYLYRIDPMNAINLGVDISDIIGYTAQNEPGQPYINFLGTDGPPQSPTSPGTFAIPRWKANANAAFTHGRWTFNYTMRFIDGMDYYPQSSYNAETTRFYHTNMVFYHDIMIMYHSNHFDVTAGINNVGGKIPQYFAIGQYWNTDTSVYDYMGRYYFLRTSTHF